MLSTPLICSSMGVATDCARVCASAPTNVAWIFASGGTMLGNCATGSRIIEIAPMTTVRIAITIATIGRLMKNFDIDYLPPDPDLDPDLNGTGVTVLPFFTFDVPSATTRSPGFKPLLMIHIVSTRSPTSTLRIVTLLFGPTTATSY